MIRLTEKEKADRFDALQTAFKVSKGYYERMRADADRRYIDAGPIGAYNKGLSDGYGRILDDLERWMV